MNCLLFTLLAGILCFAGSAKAANSINWDKLILTGNALDAKCDGLDVLEFMGLFIKFLRLLHRAADTDGDGKLTITELQNALKHHPVFPLFFTMFRERFGLKEESGVNGKLSTVVKELDMDEDQKLDLIEASGLFNLPIIEWHKVVAQSLRKTTFTPLELQQELMRLPNAVKFQNLIDVLTMILPQQI